MLPTTLLFSPFNLTGSEIFLRFFWKLRIDCSPTDDGVYLDCCKSTKEMREADDLPNEAMCKKNNKCVAAGVETGYCCVSFAPFAL